MLIKLLYAKLGSANRLVDAQHQKKRQPEHASTLADQRS